MSNKLPKNVSIHCNGSSQCMTVYRYFGITSFNVPHLYIVENPDNESDVDPLEISFDAFKLITEEESCEGSNVRFISIDRLKLLQKSIDFAGTFTNDNDNECIILTERGGDLLVEETLAFQRLIQINRERNKLIQLLSV